ncbi:NAD(P)(+)--arginine ADP-ribosyltransferase 2-like [Danio aesculapii]|uniref:NAD(P)(+)--arginine ADP-ribosyltransferase 2-like n=1 Tax=Danio aesculapii TaxID=1142201 RepID=UPI0024BF85B1|nr:NAD(P)(+)--arginine ADP-ribosyltransferase 2-like [Danio aesculapii]
MRARGVYASLFVVDISLSCCVQPCFVQPTQSNHWTELKIEALLLILAALQDHRVAADERQIFPLDMSLNSVNDLYYGCRSEMFKKVVQTYLKKELNHSADFKKAWELGKKNVTTNWRSVLKKDHKVAMFEYITTYTDPQTKVYVKLNNASRNGKQNYKHGKYNWYSLNFLLTDAIRILRKRQNTCYYTFRGTNIEFEGQAFTSVRFGSFTSSSKYRGRAEGFGKVSFFEIETCEGAYIRNYSRTPYEEEVLIPPCEVFNITQIKRNDHRFKTVYVLNSTGIMSDLNCALFRTS